MASKSGEKLHCEIYTPDGEALTGEYLSVVVPALDGYMGVMLNRAPITAVIGTGQMTLKRSEKDSGELLFVSGGFLQVRDNRVTVLAEECTPLAKLDAEEAWDQLQNAYKMPTDTDEQVHLRDEAIEAGRKKFALAQKARKDTRSMADILSGGL